MSELNGIVGHPLGDRELVLEGADPWLFACVSSLWRAPPVIPLPELGIIPPME